MQALDMRRLGELSGELAALESEMVRLEGALLKRPGAIDEAHRASARNLVDYLALRQHDLRTLQAELALLGLSSLGRAESHAMSTVQAVRRAVDALLGRSDDGRAAAKPAVGFDEGSRLLEANTEALLGPAPAGRKVRIMVTMSTEAATDYGLVRDLVRSGMDTMRINCAHDGPEAWLGMIENLRKAREETGRGCRVLMDIAGPKLRTGPIAAGPAVVRCRPKRDACGRVVAPARVWVTASEAMTAAPGPACASIPLAGRFVRQLRVGDRLVLRDARKAERKLRVVEALEGGCWAEARHTTYFVPGLPVQATRGGKAVGSRAARVGKIPAQAQTLLLKPGDLLMLRRAEMVGRPAVYGRRGEAVSPAEVSLSLPEVLDHAKAGEPVWLDDGKIGGVIRAVDGEGATVEITHAHPEGEKLGAEKGINLPETRIDLAALTAEDLEALKFIVKHADMVGYSFVRTETDVRRLLARLKELGGAHLGLVLKIETRKGFDNLPKLILAAMRARPVGIMIARGDLAVECGYERLAEIQEEILWISEAAHLPVIWATQVLETLAKTGMPSRSEITDAAMGERAECVMLNKGPYLVTAVSVLADILVRMQAHHEKKRALLRRLHLAAGLPKAG